MNCLQTPRFIIITTTINNLKIITIKKKNVLKQLQKHYYNYHYNYNYNQPNN